MAGMFATLVAGWRTALALAACAAMVVLLFANAGQRRQLGELADDLADERTASRQTVARYEIAAQTAARREVEAVARVAAEQQAITERVTDEYEVRLTNSAARYERLRQQAAAYSGSVNGADMSATGEAACRAYANAACDELPALLKAAQDNTDQLVALIAWTTAQGDVRVSEVSDD